MKRSSLQRHTRLHRTSFMRRQRSSMRRNCRPMRAHRLLVPVELRDDWPVRIFRSVKAAAQSGVPPGGANQAVSRCWVFMARARAVTAIRITIFRRSRGWCEVRKSESCENYITWCSFHLHEKVPRSKGGEISEENSVAACAPCHRHEHRDRRLYWRKNGRAE